MPRLPKARLSMIAHLKWELKYLSHEYDRRSFSIKNLMHQYGATEAEVRAAVGDHNSEFSPSISLTNPKRKRRRYS